MKQILFSILLFVCAYANASVDHPFINVVEKCLHSTKCELPFARYSGKPESFALSVLKALQDEAQGDFSSVIKSLSEALTVQAYGAEWLGNDGAQPTAYVGIPLGISFWRELAYLLLGRAYYHQKNYSLSYQQLSGVPATSPFYRLAHVELFWCAVALGKKNDLTAILMELSTIPAFDKTGDFRVIQAFVRHNEGKSDESLSEFISVARDTNVPSTIRELAFNLYADLGFRYWHDNYNSLSDARRFALLEEIIQASSSFSSSSCHEECKFFVAEAWWNRATLYRIKDPDKFKQEIENSLTNANIALSSLMDKAVKERKTSLREDAYFLGVVIAWERGDHKDAIARSNVYDTIFPVGRYREDIYQMMGDYYFETKNFKTALRFYQKLVQIGSDQKGAYGMFKAAWAFYNLGEKWSALRHMERIVFSKKSMNQDESTLSVYLESRRDMLLFLAELTDFKDALEEIHYLVDDSKERVDHLDKLAETYKQLGRFDQSSLTYLYLLDNVDFKENLVFAAKWFQELLDNQLRVRDFKTLKANFDKYITALPNDGGDVQESSIIRQFWDFIGGLTITLNREAKKVIDGDLWGVVDHLYDVVKVRNFPVSSFSFLYFGAQRFEEREMYIESALWYRRAAGENDPSREDSALSGLRIVKKLVDDYSLTGVMTDNVAKLVEDYCLWFNQNFSKSEHVHLADYLYFEALLSQNKFEQSLDGFKLLLSRDGMNEDTYKKFSFIESRLYKVEKWNEANRLVKLAQEYDSKKQYESVLRRLEEETSFQIAYTSKDRSIAEQWYLKSIDLHHDQNIFVRSWNNLFIILIDQNRFDDVVSFYDRLENELQVYFSKTLGGDSQLSSLRLLIARYFMSHYYFARANEIVFRDELLNKGTPSPATVRDLISFYGHNSVLKAPSLIDYALNFTAQEEMDDLRRIVLAINFDKISAAPKVSLKPLRPLSLFTLFDYLKRKDSSDDIHDMFSSWCKGHKTECRQIQEEPLGLSFVLELNPLPNLQGIGISKLEAESFIDEYHQKLKQDRAAAEQLVVNWVKDYDLEFKQLSQLMATYQSTPSFHVKAHVVCSLIPALNKRQKELVDYQNFVRSSFSDWKQLLMLIDERVNTSKKFEQDLKSACDKSMDFFTEIVPSNNNLPKDLLFKNPKTPFSYPTDIDEKKIVSTMTGHQSLTDRVISLLQQGLPFVAERLIYSSPHGPEFNLSIALYRIYFKDYGAAAILLKDLSGDPLVGGDAQVLQAYLRYLNGYSKLFYLSKPDSSKIKSSILKDIFEDIDD